MISHVENKRKYNAKCHRNNVNLWYIIKEVKYFPNMQLPNKYQLCIKLPQNIRSLPQAINVPQPELKYEKCLIYSTFSHRHTDLPNTQYSSYILPLCVCSRNIRQLLLHTVCEIQRHIILLSEVHHMDHIIIGYMRICVALIFGLFIS